MPEQTPNPEQELDSLAQEADDLTAQARGMVLQGEFSPQSVSAMLGALNKVLPLFEEEPVADKQITPDVVARLEMVDAAAQDAGLEPLELSASDDMGLDMLTGQLETLAADPAFKRFLKSRAPEAEAPPQQAEAPAPAAPAGGGDLDALFASRV